MLPVSECVSDLIGYSYHKGIIITVVVVVAAAAVIVSHGVSIPP
jgi:hypothetical protein